MESTKEISIFISLNVVSNAERLLSVPKRSSGVTAGEDPDAAGVRTAPGVTTASPGETDVWAGVFVPARFLSTQPEVEAAIISTIKT